MGMGNRLDLDCDIEKAKALLGADGANYHELVSHLGNDGKGGSVIIAYGDHYKTVCKLLESVIK